MLKRCSKCKEFKPSDEFYKDKSKTSGLTSHCKSCKDEYIKTHPIKRKYNSIVVLKSQLKNKYNLTIEQYDRMFEQQNGVCAICGEINENGHRLAVDHDHQTGKIRKLLCSNCNNMIGHAKENIVYLRSAINYLNSFKT